MNSRFQILLVSFIFPVTPVKQFVVWHVSTKVTNEYPVSVRTLGNTIISSTLTPPQKKKNLMSINLRIPSTLDLALK
jgi:hypothetical protein